MFLKRRQIIIERMRTNVIVKNVDKIIYGFVQLLLVVKIIKINEFGL